MKNAFTLIELLVVIAIIGTLTAFFVPALGKAREQGRRVKCMNNLHQHGVAWYLYLDDHNDSFPNPSSPGGADLYSFGGKTDQHQAFPAAERVLNRYLGIENDSNPNVELFHCPDDLKPNAHEEPFSTFNANGNSYYFNDSLFDKNLTVVARPKDRIFMEMDNDFNNPGHGGNIVGLISVMVLFVDGHVAGPFLYSNDFETLLGNEDDKKVYRFCE